MFYILVDNPPIAVVLSPILSFDNFTNYRRRMNEVLQTFASKFRGLAAEHIMHCGSDALAQTGEVLAIPLVNNAKVSE